MSIRYRTVVVAATLAVITTAATALAADGRRPGPVGLIGGPYAALLTRSDNLGPASTAHVRLTASLEGSSSPGRLIEWANTHRVDVQWRPGDDWATLAGSAGSFASAFGVDVNSYRAAEGQVFYASPQQPAVPADLRGEVDEFGRILGYTPHREADRFSLPREVPGQGLTPATLMKSYNIAPLHDSGFRGKGQTVVVFAFDGFDQSDLDLFADNFGLPRFTPDVVGGQPSARRGEATMDLEAIHAVAPEAKKVLVNARPTVEGDGSYTKIATMMEDAERRYPGAVWSFSIGWGCDKLITAADLKPVRAALAAALRQGTTAFDASGDLAGLECKGGEEWSAPPHPDNVGLDAVASLPEMTNVGGTTLSTDDTGGWLGEQAWFDGPLSQGTAGGVSALFERPPWQAGVNVREGGGRRLTPDISAVADPFTGVKIVFGGNEIVGGGTSLSAPLWAGIAAVVNQYLTQRGGSPLGDLNPLLYRAAEGARLPAFQDIVQGGNAVYDAGPGYDLVTGLGTPNVENLAKVMFVTQGLLP